MLLSSYAAYAMLYYALVWGAMKFWVLEFERLVFGRTAFKLLEGDAGAVGDG